MAKGGNFAGANVATFKAQTHQAHSLAAALGDGLARAHQLVGLLNRQAGVLAEAQDVALAPEFGGGALQFGIHRRSGGGRGGVGAAFNVDRCGVAPGLHFIGHRGRLKGFGLVPHDGVSVLADRHQRDQVWLPIGGDHQAAGAIFTAPVNACIHRKPSRASAQPWQRNVHRCSWTIHHYRPDQFGDACLVPLQRQISDRAPDRI